MHIIKSYPGAKSGVHLFKIINLITPHHNYLELFLGSGQIILHKKPASGSNICMDLDDQVISKWKRSGLPHTFLCSDALIFLENLAPELNNKNTFIYLDPPYPKQTRWNPNLYRFDSSPEFQNRLLDLINLLKCNILISTYDTDLYKTKLSHWNKLDYKAPTRGKVKIETLYFNYNNPIHLHQYDYLGSDWIDRQRIKRKIQRHIKRLKSLPALERAALLNSLTAEHIKND